MSYDPLVAHPRLLLATINADGGSLWLYASGDDVNDVEADGYFTDGASRGMKVGDVVFVVHTSTGAANIRTVTAVQSPSPATSYAGAPFGASIGEVEA